MPGGIRLPSRYGPSRRHVLRALFTLGMLAGASAVLAPVVTAARRAAGGAAGEAAAGTGTEEEPLDEMYRGRRIQVCRIGSPEVSRASAESPFRSAHLFDIRIDGRPLQVMWRADGGCLSVVNHYESFPTPLEAARAAVDDLDGAQLSLSGPVHHI